MKQSVNWADNWREGQPLSWRRAYAAEHSLIDCLGIWLRSDAPAPLLIHPLRTAASRSTDSLEAGSKLQLLRILTTFSPTFLPFYQCNNAVSVNKLYLRS